MFCTPNYEITEIDEIDIPHIVKIYNSNTNFVKNHIGAESISEEWVLKEYREMQKIGFSSCKIVDMQSALPVGFIDFKISYDTYLSLIMINSEIKKNGIGKEVMKYFEKYAKSKNSKRIRIDVVINYDESVTQFWINNGFIPEKEITLSWNGKELPALKMLKVIS